MKGLDAKGEGFKEFCREFNINVRRETLDVRRKGERKPRPMVRPEQKQEIKAVYRWPEGR